MKNVYVLFRRELAGYFATPVAYVFLCIFLILSGTLTFQFGDFYDRGQADLIPFFNWHPWLYLLLMPALSMRLWSEERRGGTIELLMTLPVTTLQAVLGKFLAAWTFTAIALAGTFPMWMTVAYLGDPDHGVIVASYLGSLLMAGGYLAFGAAISALTKNQVIAFVLSLVLSLAFLLAGWPAVLDFVRATTGSGVANAVASMSFLTHFNAIAKGVIDLRDFVFFVSMIVCFLYVNAVLVDLKKAD